MHLKKTDWQLETESKQDLSLILQPQVLNSDMNKNAQPKYSCTAEMQMHSLNSSEYAIAENPLNEEIIENVVSRPQQGFYSEQWFNLENSN